MAAWQVRPATVAEYAAVADLTVRAYAGLTGMLVEDDYAAELRDVAGHAAVADVLVACGPDDALAGAVTFIPDAANPLAEHGDPGAASLRFLAVEPAVQRAGVAGALVQACLARAAASGATRLRLHVAAGNPAAHRLYARWGFARDPAADWAPTPHVALLGYVRDVR